MSFLDKSGDMKYGVLVSLIILLVSFVAIFIFTSNFNIFLGEASEDEICRTSILAAAQSKSFLNIGKSAVSLNCPRKELIIKKKDVVENGVINQNKAHKIIAEEMYRCWNKVGAGQLDPFSNWEGKGESYCLICSTINFDDELLEYTKTYENYGKNTNAYIHSPIAYLVNTKIPNSDVTYQEYLYKEKDIPRLTKNDKETIDSTGLLPNSLILVQMYKKDEKSIFSFHSYANAALALGFLVTGLFTGGLTWIGAASTIGFYTTLAATVISTGDNVFSACPDCNAIGGVQLVPPNAPLNMKMKVLIDREDKEIPLCSRIVN